MSSPPPPLPSYRKPWLSYADQIALLKSRGMVIEDVRSSIEFLQHINYYLIDKPPWVANAPDLMGLAAIWKTHPLWK